MSDETSGRPRTRQPLRNSTDDVTSTLNSLLNLHSYLLTKVTPPVSLFPYFRSTSSWTTCVVPTAGAGHSVLGDDPDHSFVYPSPMTHVSSDLLGPTHIPLTYPRRHTRAECVLLPVLPLPNINPHLSYRERFPYYTPSTFLDPTEGHRPKTSTCPSLQKVPGEASFYLQGKI